MNNVNYNKKEIKLNEKICVFPAKSFRIKRI